MLDEENGQAADSGVRGLLAMIVVVATVGVFQIALPVAKLAQANRQSIERIRCADVGRAPGAGKRCDISELMNDWELDRADFLLIKGARHFVLSNPQYRSLWLNFSDPEFVRRFRGFETWEAPTGEVWRLYSERREIRNRGVEIMVGQSVKADWDLVNHPLSPEVDVALKQEVDRIALRVIVEGGRVESRRVNSRADGWQVVEADTGRVVRWNGQIPAVFPKDRRLGAERMGLYREGGDVLVVRADENDDVLAVSVAHVEPLSGPDGNGCEDRSLGHRCLALALNLAADDGPGVSTAGGVSRLLQFNERRLGLRLRHLQVAGLARRLGLVHEPGGADELARPLRAGEGLGRLRVLTAGRLSVLAGLGLGLLPRPGQRFRRL